MKLAYTLVFYIDQWLANFYLESIDRLIVQQPGIRGYYRYMDNMQLFGNRKRQIHKVIRMIDKELSKIGLRLKSNWQLFPLDNRMLLTVGYRIGRDCVILRKRNFLRLTRQCRRAIKRKQSGKSVSPKMAMSIISRVGQLKHCDSWFVYQKYISPIDEDYLKQIIGSAMVKSAK